VHCDDPKHKFSKVYKDINEAIRSFVTIQKKLP